MRKNKVKIIILGLFINLPLIASLAQDNETDTPPITDITVQENVGSDWYLINERIADDEDNLFNELFFADKNSLTGNMEELSLSISNLNFGEEKIDRKFQLQIIDSRMQVSINCEEQMYRIDNLEQYDQANRKIADPVVQIQNDQWQKTDMPSFQALVKFSCNPDDGNYEQPFDPELQPLTGLIDYLNADWGK